MMVIYLAGLEPTLMSKIKGKNLNNVLHDFSNKLVFITLWQFKKIDQILL